MCMMAMKGDADAAAEIDQTLAGLHKNLFIESNPIPVKWVLHKLGLIEDGIRLPLTWLEKEHETPLYDAMKQAKLI